MGKCEPELGPSPPPVPDWCEGLDEKLKRIVEAMEALRVSRALKEVTELRVCSSRALSICGNELFTELTIKLPKCVSEFYKLCDFDRLIRICPFDPAWDAFDWKQQVTSERLQVLEVQVKELQAKLPTTK